MSTKVQDLAKELSGKLPAYFGSARKELQDKRSEYNQERLYLRAASYALAIGQYAAVLDRLSAEPYYVTLQGVMDMLSYERRMCSEYWNEIVDGPDSVD